MNGTERQSLKAVSQPFLGECAPRLGFEVSLKRECLSAIRECNNGFELPRAIRCRCRDGTRIVMLQAIVKVLCKARVEMIVTGLASQDVNIEECVFHHWRAES